MSNILAFGSSDNYVTASVDEAIEMAENMGIPIQAVVCYYSKEYFSDGWVYPQPYELVYEYGEVGTKTLKEYSEYFFERLKARPSVRLFEKDDDHYRLLFVALLCSRFPLLLVYLLLRYQWYNRYCFHAILAIAAVLSLLA